MKKLFLTVLVALFVSGAYAQIGAGVKAGVNFANQDIDDITTESRTGYHFGAFFEIKTSNNFAVQPELLYSTQGAKFPDLNSEINFSYLTIPVLFKAKFLEVVNLHVGPQVAFLFNAEDQDDMDKKDVYKSTDWAIAAGAGIELPMGLTGGVRYVWGLSDVNSDNPNFSNMTIKNRNLQVYLGLALF